MAERYQMVACIGLRTSNPDEMVTVPLYVKLREQEGRLPEEQENMIHRISECMLQRYEQQFADFINKKKQGGEKSVQAKK